MSSPPKPSATYPPGLYKMSAPVVAARDHDRPQRSPSFKDQMRHQTPTTPTTAAATTAEPSLPTLLVDALPVFEYLERQPQQQPQQSAAATHQQPQQLQPQQRPSPSGATNDGIVLSISKKQFYIIIVVVVMLLAGLVVVATICDTGKICRRSTSVVVSSSSSSSSSHTTTTTVSPISQSPPTLVPTTLPTVTTRSMSEITSILTYINFITHSDQPLPYPNNNATAEERTLLWLIHDDPVTKASNELALTQRYALGTLWFQTTTGFGGLYWATEVPECEWEFVRCDNAGRVISVNIYNKGVRGHIPADFGLLTDLTIMVLGFTIHLRGRSRRPCVH